MVPADAFRAGGHTDDLHGLHGRVRRHGDAGQDFSPRSLGIVRRQRGELVHDQFADAITNRL